MKSTKQLTLLILNCPCLLLAEVAQVQSAVQLSKQDAPKEILVDSVSTSPTNAQKQLDIYFAIPLSIREGEMDDYTLFTEKMISNPPKSVLEGIELCYQIAQEALKREMPPIYKQYYQESYELLVSTLEQLKKTSDVAEQRKIAVNVGASLDDIKYLPRYQEILSALESMNYLYCLADCCALKETIRNNKVFDSAYSNRKTLAFYLLLSQEKSFSQIVIDSQCSELSNHTLKELKAENKALNKQILEIINAQASGSR